MPIAQLRVIPTAFSTIRSARKGTKGREQEAEGTLDRRRRSKVRNSRVLKYIFAPFREIRFPEKTVYNLSSVFLDLLDLSAKLLRIGGRIAFWFPVLREE